VDVAADEVVDEVDVAAGTEVDDPGFALHHHGIGTLVPVFNTKLIR